MSKATAETDDHGLATLETVRAWAAEVHLGAMTDEQALHLARLVNWYGSTRVEWRGAAVAKHVAEDRKARQSDIEALLRVAIRCYNRGDVAAGNGAMLAYESEMIDGGFAVKAPDGALDAHALAPNTGKPPLMETRVANLIGTALAEMNLGQKQARDGFVQQALTHLGVRSTDGAISRARRRRT